MPMIKHDPFREVEKFFEDDFFGFFPAVRRHFAPPMDIYQTDNDLIVELQLPKDVADKVSISIEEGVLSINNGDVQEEEVKDKNYYRREIRKGGFARSVALPFLVKEEETKATYENGVLKIIMPKTEVKKPKKIEVNIK